MITEQTAMTKAREVWPEAEGFERARGGWTFRVGAGYASVADSGRVAEHPQGTRGYAVRFMPTAGAGNEDQDQEVTGRRCNAGHLWDEECPECE